MKKRFLFVCAMGMTFCFGLAANAREASVVSISTAEELAAMSEDLTADYVLEADIDLSGMEWTPIGAYAPSGESPEEQEIPAQDLAFTGTFDGNGHTISNLTITGQDGMAVGLFGCIANTEVGNFTLENASVEGTIMVSDVVGYSFNSTVHDVTLKNGLVTAYAGELSGEGMYGGVVGAGMDSWIRDCSAQADVVIPDGTANAGIVGGGLELTSLVNCNASGTVTAGDNCYGIGGVSGCGFGAEEFTGCHAKDVQITVGENCYWIGGVTGYAGGYEDSEFGVPVTVFTDCTAENVSVTRTAGKDDIVGGAFYNEEVAAYGAPYDQPTVYVFQDDAENAEAADAAEEEGTEAAAEEGTGEAADQADGAGTGEAADQADEADTDEAADSTDGTDTEDADAAADADRLLQDLAGTYTALFPVITDPAYDQIWLDNCTAAVGEEKAPEVAEMLKAACNGTIYGQEAIDAFGDGSEGAQFDCLFINGVSQFVFDGNVVSGLDENGETITSHEYAFAGPASIAGVMDGYLYKTEDPDAGEFTYLFLLPDTPATTFHTEFRYGSDPEALMEYNAGPYAYWLAAGFPADADQKMIEDVITLFCEENLAEMSTEEAG